MTPGTHDTEHHQTQEFTQTRRSRAWVFEEVLAGDLDLRRSKDTGPVHTATLRPQSESQMIYSHASGSYHMRVTVFAGMPGEICYRRQIKSLLLRLFDVFRALINSLVCWFGIWSLSILFNSNSGIAPSGFSGACFVLFVALHLIYLTHSRL